MNAAAGAIDGMPSAAAAALDALFPPEVIGVTATPELEALPLLPAEAACIPRAVPKRRREFGLGRACARLALARLGIRDVPIIMAADRSPVWPAGVAGSISHCEGFCAAVVARRGSILDLGLDAEPAQPLPPELIRRVCTPWESSRIEGLPPAPAGDWYRLAFCAKESVYKALYPAVRRVLEFSEVEIDFDPAGNRFIARPASERLAADVVGRALVGRFAFTGSHMLTGVTVYARHRPASPPSARRG